MKDAVATMGGILPDDAGGRDAVHVAVFSATCEQKVYPGQDVQLISKGEDCVVSTLAPNPIGIVDPFLKQTAQPGQRFWVFLYPRTITGLSHRWQHPAFEESNGVYAKPSDKITSEQWLRDFCAKNDCPRYDLVIKALQGNGDGSDGYVSWTIDNEYFTFIGTDAHANIPDEFWEHAEKVLGHKIGLKPKYFSCSC